ncbi:MAG: site-2 protease family protein [Saprospiraceae bacterium]|nr:site-2 protease family protein [Saprospiraceae bacterium]
MGRSFTIAVIQGIPLKVHWSFSLLILFVIYTGFADGLNLQRSLVFAAYILVLFTCVVLHEYGHALAAKRYKVNTKDIILSPIGGIARLEKLPEKPIEEFVIAIAGPLVNVVIAIILSAIILTTSDFTLFPKVEDITQVNTFSDFGRYIVILNIVLFIFNLIPAFPMDGGRILRALLAMRIGRRRATNIASVIGRILAVGFIGFAIYTDQITLALIGVFIFTSAGAEAKYTNTYAILEELAAIDVMKTQFTKLHLSDIFAMPIDLRRRNIESNFLIFDSLGYISGSLPEAYVAEAEKRKLEDQPVTSMMSPKIEYVSPNSSVKDIFEIMNTKGLGIVAVGDINKLLGVIDRNTIRNLLAS